MSTLCFPSHENYLPSSNPHHRLLRTVVWSRESTFAQLGTALSKVTMLVSRLPHLWERGERSISDMRSTRAVLCKSNVLTGREFHIFAKPDASNCHGTLFVFPHAKQNTPYSITYSGRDSRKAQQLEIHAKDRTGSSNIG